MTTSQGHDRARFFSYSFVYLLVCSGDDQTPGAKRARDGVSADRDENMHLDDGANCRIDVKI